MKFKKFIVLIILAIGFSTVLIAQDYTVTKKSDRINNTKYEGYTINVNGPVEKVTEQVYSYLKVKSKIRRKRNHYTIAALKMDKIELDSTVIYLRIDAKGIISQVWMAIKPMGIEEDRVSNIEDGLQEELVLIARNYYVYQQELKIKEAETAAQVVSKKQQFLIDEKGSLSNKLTSAKVRKTELEELLVENDLLIKSLNQQLIDNQFAQDSTYLDLQKINKVIDLRKQELKEIK